MAEHMEHDTYHRERISAVAIRLVNLGWFRVGSDRYARSSGAYGITTLTKRHVEVTRSGKIAFRFKGKAGAQVRTTLVDDELAGAMRELLRLPGGRRLFRYEWEGDLYDLTDRRLNNYVKIHLGNDFTAKDFRTWGGTLLAAIFLAEKGVADTEPEARRTVAAAMRRVADRLGNTPAVARTSYVSPAVIEQYFDGRTIDDFRPPHLRVVRARDTGLDPEEQALLSLLRSSRMRRALAAA